MALTLLNLDDLTRIIMISEVDADIMKQTLYLNR